MQSTADKIKYIEALSLPRLDRSIDRLVTKHWNIMTDYHITSLGSALDLVKKAMEEGNSVLIRHDFIGYYIEVWKDKITGTK